MDKLNTKLNCTLLLIFCLLSLFSMATWARQTQSQRKAQPAWEYLIVSYSEGLGLDELNKLGMEGWELVAVRSSVERLGNLITSRTHYYLKRAK